MAEVIEKKISEFKPGDIVQGFFYIRDSEMKQTTNNNKYMNFTFSDNTGDINAKLWDWDETNITRFATGVLVKARGTVLDWQGQLQYKLDLLRRTNDDDKICVSDFIPCAPYEPKEMYDYIVDTIDNMKDEEIKTFVKYIIEKNKQQIMFFPAAKKNHHSVRSGLLYHVSSMLKVAKSLTEIYPGLKKDLLYAGVILHDIGKLEEMETTEIGLVSDYSKDGKLLGHIIEGIKMLSEATKETNFNKEKGLLLEHMILSHHYEPEYGSPKYPMFAEAEILHYLDIMDARIYDMQKATEMVDNGKFSERIFTLENRNIYKPNF